MAKDRQLSIIKNLLCIGCNDPMQGGFFVPKSLVHKKPQADVHRGEGELPPIPVILVIQAGGSLLWACVMEKIGKGLLNTL